MTNSLPKIDKPKLKKLVRYSGHNNRLWISFDHDLIDERIVVFDPETKYLTIKQLPDDLLAELDPSNQLTDGDGTDPAPR